MCLLSILQNFQKREVAAISSKAASPLAKVPKDDSHGLFFGVVYGTLFAAIAATPEATEVVHIGLFIDDSQLAAIAERPN